MSSKKLRGAAFTGKHGCEHQDFMQPVEIIHGEGRDAGTVRFRVGDTFVFFNSVEALITALGSERSGVSITRFAAVG